MHAYVPGEQPVDLSVIKLNTNENPYPPSPRISRLLTASDMNLLRRYPDPMCTKLRLAIARLHGCSINHVFVGNGSDEILALCTRAFVEDKGSIGYFEPSYSLYPVLARIRNVKTRPVRLNDDFQWRMPARFQSSLFFLANPNSPTGIRYAKQTVTRFCRRLRGVVVLDEAYVDFAAVNCADLALKFTNTLALRTLSKAYSLAGLRVGYAIGAPDLISALFKIKDSYNLSRLTQRLAQAAIEDQAHMRANLGRIIATRSRLALALRKLNFTVFPSQTNFVWCRPGGMSALNLYRRLREKNIFVRYFTGPLTDAHLRITVGTDEQINALLRAIAGVGGGHKS